MEFWDAMSVTQRELAGEFTRDVEDFLHVKQNRLSFGEEWAKSPPEDAKGQTRDEYMKMVCHYLLFPYVMSRLI
jgi:hypothetical protein